MALFTMASYATYIWATGVSAILGVPLIALTAFAATYLIAELMAWRPRP